MAQENKYILTGPFMRENGKMINLTDLVVLFIQTEMCMKEI